ncbi:hypothetical protein E6O75_ATG01596 [Venturia nashicola]|uniref:Uncharacterized protein n=1 Tax=Venturia nashicola TaxID=86259 RepID=A0A4Z1PF91_9PEZI|nr:hypothetical protein E6O75_ATG01596 [Venturia nashicola]
MPAFESLPRELRQEILTIVFTETIATDCQTTFGPYLSRTAEYRSAAFLTSQTTFDLCLGRVCSYSKDIHGMRASRKGEMFVWNQGEGDVVAATPVRKQRPASQHAYNIQPQFSLLFYTTPSRNLNASRIIGVLVEPLKRFAYFLRHHRPNIYGKSRLHRIRLHPGSFAAIPPQATTACLGVTHVALFPHSIGPARLAVSPSSLRRGGLRFLDQFSKPLTSTLVKKWNFGKESHHTNGFQSSIFWNDGLQRSRNSSLTTSAVTPLCQVFRARPQRKTSCAAKSSDV